MPHTHPTPTCACDDCSHALALVFSSESVPAETYETQCCHNYICQLCAVQYLRGTPTLWSKLVQPVSFPVFTLTHTHSPTGKGGLDAGLTEVPKEAVDTPCPHCNTKPVTIHMVAFDVKPRQYEESPRASKKIESMRSMHVRTNSPLKFDDSYEDMKVRHHHHHHHSPPPVSSAVEL